ncbi:MAG: hypothetical protein QOG67_3222 [Verrucomicrobiota bacterium]|jgi:hypothetical protein
MKIQHMLRITMGLLLLNGLAQGDDRLGASTQELDRLKQLNKSNTAVSLSDQELSKLMVGKWTTGRHEYFYRSDGTWSMLPTDISTTSGKWRIQNRQLIEERKSEDGGFLPQDARTFLEATAKQLVLKNDKGMYPFRYIRIE